MHSTFSCSMTYCVEYFLFYIWKSFFLHFSFEVTNIFITISFEQSEGYFFSFQYTDKNLRELFFTSFFQFISLIFVPVLFDYKQSIIFFYINSMESSSLHVFWTFLYFSIDS